MEGREMTYQKRIFNSVSFAPNPWVPKMKQFYTPWKHTMVLSEDNEKITINMCRLCLLFPTIKINYMQKILKLHQCNITDTIDTLLLIQTIQKQIRRERCNSEYLRKLTCARCVPFQVKPLIAHILEEEVRKDERVILPNITFGRNTTSVFYEHELNFDLPSAQIENELNVVRFQTFDEPNIKDETLQVVDPDDAPGPSRCNLPIKLRVLRKTTGQYSSQLIE